MSEGKRNERSESISPGSMLDQHEYLIINEEEKQYQSHSPFKTVLLFSIGPLASQFIASFAAILNSILVAKTCGDTGITVLGAVFVVEFIPISLIDYFLNIITLRISYLFGQKNPQEIGQFIIDVIRFALLVGILTPALILPITTPLTKYFGADNDLAKLCLQYMIPETAGSFFSYFYQIQLGLLQSEGRSVLYGIVQLISFILNIGFLGLFLFWLKLPIWGASLAVVCSQAIPAVILFALTYKKKFQIEINFSMFFKKLSSETFPAIKVAFTSFFLGISYSIPLILIQKYLSDAALAIDQYDNVIGVWGVINCVFSLVEGVCIGFNYGYIPPASYSFGGNLFPRLKKLTFSVLGVSTVVSSLLGYIFVFIPDKIALIWDDDPSFIFWSKIMIPWVFYGMAAHALQYTVSGLLQSMQMMVDANLISLITLFLAFPTVSTILYVTKKDDPVRILYTFAICDGFAFLVGLLGLIRPFKRMKNDNQIAGNCSSQKNELISIPLLN